MYYYDIAPEGVEAIKSEGKFRLIFYVIWALFPLAPLEVSFTQKQRDSSNPVVMPPVNLEEMIENDLVLRNKLLNKNRK